MNYIIESPDDWFVKAGAYIDEKGLLHHPYTFLSVSMAAAAEAVVAFRTNDSLLERHKNALIIANSVRSADTAYYTKVAEMLLSKQGNEKIHFCHNCLRGQLWPNRMKVLRKKVNSKIIHGMDKGAQIKTEDLNLVLEYYEEMLTHQLIPSKLISCEERKEVKFCDNCREKHAARDTTKPKSENN
jgi:hypothetical protein